VSLPGLVDSVGYSPDRHAPTVGFNFTALKNGVPTLAKEYPAAG